MNWELAIKVATIIIGGLTLIDKAHELVKKRQARQRFTRKSHVPANWFLFLKARLSEALYSPPNNLVLLSNFMGAPLLIKKIPKVDFSLDSVMDVGV